MSDAHTRRCFYITGEYRSGAEKTQPGSSYMTNQTYMEELTPKSVTKPYPLLFWPGTGSTGTCFATTPDGRPGWASYFIRHGYTVYLVDPPGRGRSAPGPQPDKTIHVDSKYAETFWTATAQNGGKWPQAHLHTQWPGSGKRGDPTFDQFMASQSPSTSDYGVAEIAAQAAGAALLRQIGPVILCTHSSGASPGWLIADAEPDLVKGIIAIEPIGPPFRNHTTSIVTSTMTQTGVNRPYGITINPLTYSPIVKDFADLLSKPPPAHILSNLSNIPILVVTGESGYHVQYDYQTVAFLEAAGASVKHLKLADIGIRGNGHFMFLEKNSDDIADAIRGWLELTYKEQN